MMIRFNTILFYFFVLLPVCFINSQDKNIVVIQDENGLELQINFEPQQYILEGENNNIISYFNAIDESNPGSPVLPSKTIFIAIPPNSKVNLTSLSEETSIIKSVIPKSNPDVELAIDSSLIYKETKIDRKYSLNELYPINKYDIIGYTWIRDYYCAVLKINTHRYNWSKRNITEMLKTKIRITFSDVQSFNLNTSQPGVFDESLKSFIVNYEQASKFRTYHNYSSNDDSSGSWIDYSKEYVKLDIPNDGLYRIYFDDLLSYGITPEIVNPTTFKLFSKGTELPLYIFGEGDQSFDPGDYIEFWAERNYGSPNYREIVEKGEDYQQIMDRYSDTSTVWLTWDGGQGKRIETIDTYLPNLTDSITTHLAKVHLEENTRLWYYGFVNPRIQLPFWQENKVWTWLQASGPGTSSFNFNADFIVPNSSVFTISRLLSWFVNASIIRLNAHKFGAKLNSSNIQDSVMFDFESTGNLVTSFNSNLLTDGQNTYKIVGMPNDASTPQKALLDWVDVEYEQYTSATNDSILVNIPSALSTKFRVIKISNITVSDFSLLLYKINSQKKKINNFQLSGGVLTFTDTVGGGDRYYIISESYLQSPVFIKKKQFINLRDPSKSADYIIVSNKILSSSVAEYANFISNNYNVNVEIVYVDDIYDEFGYGYFKPEPIKDFLKFAFNNWQQPSPSYLVIIGDGTYDYKDFFIDVPDPRKRTLVPSYGNPVSDVWFTTWDTTNTDIQQMFVGRIPANSNEEVYRYLEKHQTYINRGFDEWNKKFLFFSGGDPNLISELNQIKQANDRVLNNVVEPSPVGGSSIHFYKTLDPPSNFGPYTFEEIQDGIDEGGLFISYVGHSGTRTWDNGITDVDDLENAYDDRLPLISDNGCSTGKFAEPDVDAFGELFINQDERGQAIIYMGNTSLGYTSTAFRMPELFYNRLIVNPSESVGKTHFLTKMDNFNQYGFSTTNRLYSYTNLLLGDPLIKFTAPEKPNFVVRPDFIKILESVLTENDDSANVELIVTNLGRADSDSLSILITGIYSDSTLFSIQNNLSAPLFKDTIDFVIPIFGLVGEHTLRVEIDPNNLIDEISKDDNIASINFLVSSTNLRPVEAEEFYTSKRSIITLLNPSIQSGENSDKIEFAYATTDAFINPIVKIKNLDTLITRVSLNGLIPQQRYYWRTRLNSEQFEWGATFSFYNEMDNSWLFNKSFRMNEVVSENTVFDSSSNFWALQLKNNELNIVSASANDGTFGSIQYNREEMLPNTFYWGIATAELDTLTIKPQNIKYFVGLNIVANADSLINYIESLSNGAILILTISADAAQTVLGFGGGTPVRQAIETLGSVYIDSVRYRDSWSMIGVKAAPTGSVLESFSKRFEGTAAIDTSKELLATDGYIQLPVIKNSIKWLKAFKSDSITAGSNLDYFVRGIKSDNIIDTLGTVSFIGDSASISFIDAEIYPQIDFVVNFTANNLFESPIFKSLGVNFIPPPELATNYQVVSSTADTVLIGEDVGLSFYVYNVGESKADSFKVKVDVGNDDNSSNTIFEQIVDSLGSNERKLFTLTFNTSTGLGAKTFMIDIDSDKQIRELYEDNNFYTVPFYIKQDTSIPSLNISFDGTDILDGDYISPSPEIKIELSDESLLPISDTSAITIFLNDDPIYYAINQSVLSISFNEENPKAIVTYTPELKDGDYILKVFGKNSLDNVADSSGLEKQFRVSNEVKLLEVYNYPNPTSGETHFTFKLSQIPDEVKIKIYTIAGRLIKEINIPPTDLKYDFNKIYWDGRDEDGDILGNGVYLYKVILTAGEKTEKVIQKLAIVR